MKNEDYKKKLSELQEEVDKYSEKLKEAIEESSAPDYLDKFAQESKKYFSQIGDSISKIDPISPSQKKELANKVEDYKNNVQDFFTSKKFPEDVTQKFKENMKSYWEKIDKQVTDLVSSNEDE